jgi:hypothetical protein
VRAHGRPRESLMHRLRNLLRWFRIEDETGGLSLTTVAFVVGCICLLKEMVIPLDALAAFALALAAYQGKRHREHKWAAHAADITARAEQLKVQQEHQVTLDGAKGRIDEIARTVEELAGKVRRAAGNESDAQLGGALKRR